jgi:hypothetical protein
LSGGSVYEALRALSETDEVVPRGTRIGRGVPSFRDRCEQATEIVMRSIEDIR